MMSGNHKTHDHALPALRASLLGMSGQMRIIGAALICAALWLAVYGVIS
jgi:hypothetical protein